MASILTDILVSYDARNPYKQGNILIELTRWIESNGMYKAEISDYLYELVTENEQEYPRKTFLSSKPISISVEVYNSLSDYA